MKFTNILLTFFVALYQTLYAAARRGKGGGGGGGKGGSGSGKDDLDLTVLDLVVFSIYVTFAVIALLQFIGSFGLYRKRCPDEDFPRRTLYTVFITLFVASLAAAYALGASVWASTHRRTPSVTPPRRIIYAMEDFTPRLANMFILAAILFVLRNRRNALVSEQRDMMGGLSQANPPAFFYKLGIIFYFGTMLVTAIVRFGIRMSTDRVLTPAMLTLYQVVDHVYLALYILLTAKVVISAIILRRQTERYQSIPLMSFDQNVLGRIVKMICPTLVFRSVCVLAAHIITYMGATIAVDPTIFGLVRIVCIASPYVYVAVVAADLGTIPKKSGGRKWRR